MEYFSFSQMCEHDSVQTYITDLLESICPALQKNMIEKIVFVVLDSSEKPIEKFVFEVSKSTKQFE